MGFIFEVTGDALEHMQDVWDDVRSFTRAELGGAPDWADYVNELGMLFAARELEDDYADHLDEICDAAFVCGYSFDAGRALRALDPIAFREEFLGWLDMRVRDGDLRSVEG